VPGIAPRLSGRRVLVTGAGGFIGSHVVEALVQEGARVRALVRYSSRGSRGWLDALTAERLADVETFAGDIRDGPTVDRAVDWCEIVLHLASLIAIPYSYLAPEAYVATNVVGTQHVLDACRRHDVGRIVHTSTSEVYGTAQRVPIDETHPLHPQSPYAASKASADLLALSYHASFGSPVVVLRPFNTYGPRQSLRAIIPTIAAQLLAGGPVRIGATAPTRDFTYVTDTADGFVRAATADAVGQVVQLGTGSEISIGDVAKAIADVVGTPLRLESDETRLRPASSEVLRLVSDASRARAVLGWTPRVSLSDGLRKTVEWLRDDPSVTRAREYVR
jgi:dTDP-glucose 4,6-dehydratase